MDVIDRSTIPALHTAARRHRSLYVSCLVSRLTAAIANLFHSRPTARTAPCA